MARLCRLYRSLEAPVVAWFHLFYPSMHVSRSIYILGQWWHHEARQWLELRSADWICWWQLRPLLYLRGSPRHAIVSGVLPIIPEFIGPVRSRFPIWPTRVSPTFETENHDNRGEGIRWAEAEDPIKLLLSFGSVIKFILQLWTWISLEMFSPVWILIRLRLPTQRLRTASCRNQNEEYMDISRTTPSSKRWLKHGWYDCLCLLYVCLLEFFVQAHVNKAEATKTEKLANDVFFYPPRTAQICW